MKTTEYRFRIIEWDARPKHEEQGAVNEARVQDVIDRHAADGFVVESFSYLVGAGFLVLFAEHADELGGAPDRRIGTTRFGCGCTVHVEPDVNGITPWLEHCARQHAGAPALIDATASLLRDCLANRDRRGLGAIVVEHGGALRAALKPFAADPLMCREPERCAGRGSCPRDPACNE